MDYHVIPTHSGMDTITVIGIILAVWLMAGWVIGILWGAMTDWSK